MSDNPFPFVAELETGSPEGNGAPEHSRSGLLRSVNSAWHAVVGGAQDRLLENPRVFVSIEAQGNAVYKFLHRCIPCDLTYVYVWSRGLLFITLMATCLQLSCNAVLDHFSDATCTLGHTVAVCDENGVARDAILNINVPLDPVEGTTMGLDVNAVIMLLVICVVALANSRHLSSLHPCWTTFALACALIGTAFQSFSMGMSLRTCSRSYIDYPKWLEAYRPNDVNGGWIGPTEHVRAKQVLSHCSVDAFDEASFTPSDTSKKWMQMKSVTKSAQESTIAWQSSATFAYHVTSLDEFNEFCLSVGYFTFGSGDTQGWWACYQDLFKAKRRARFSPSWCFNEMMALLPGVYCDIFIDNVAFLPEPNMIGWVNNTGLNNPDVLADFALSVARRGVNCPQEWSTFPNSTCSSDPKACGAKQVQGANSTCTYNSVFLDKITETDAAGVEVTKLVPKTEMAKYLNSNFLKCVMSHVQSCSNRIPTWGLTRFRNSATLVASLCLFVGGLWLWYIQTSMRNHWVRPPLVVNISRALRDVLASRVVVGLLIAEVMEVVVTAWLWSLAGRFLPTLDPDISHLSADEAWTCFFVFVWGQFLLFTVAVFYNLFKYIQIREQVLSLPAESFFGDGLIPADYEGPDLRLMSEMAKSSVLYAQYFPGIVFWHMLSGSFVLMFFATAFLYLMILVLQPQERRLEYAHTLWDSVCEAFVLGAVITAHYVQRLFAQRCLMYQTEEGMQLRRPCLFAMLEILYLLIAFALGPLTALYDFGKSFFSTAIASLLVATPNFVQFGELSDYVYCSYCAVLYLERVADDHRRGVHRQEEDVQTFESSRVLDPHAEIDPIQDTIQEKRKCVCQCLLYWSLLILLPVVMSCLLNYVGQGHGYECVPFLLPSINTCWS